MDSLIGKTVDNYQIIEEVGRGGMGIVYKAIDTSLEKIVALKMIDPALARDESFLKRFRTEARALARLENPNIVIVHALRTTDAGVFMVMEYVDAKTVADWIRKNGAFSVEEMINVAKQLLHAIDHAHKVEVIHRDIKPSNILLYDDGRVKVTDFGLAKVIEQRGRHSTVTQGRAGTLYYMSPEQIKGMKNVDYRSDIYSLGMTIYEMLAGRVPFEKTESDFTIQKLIVEGKIPSINKYNPDIPKPLNKIILKSIENDPDKRYQNCREMLGAIEEYEKSQLIEKDTTSPTITKYPFIAAAVLFVAIGAYFLWNTIISSPDDPTPPDMATISVRSEPEGASVFIDNDSVGVTPLHDIELPAGDVPVRINKAGMVMIDTVVSVSRGATSLLSFTLQEIGPIVAENGNDEPVHGRMSVNSTPRGASIYLDGQFLGTTPYHNDEVPAGRYRLTLRSDGYETYTETLNIPEAREVSVSASLKAFGGVHITSDPPGADVLLNGERVGTTPFDNRELAAGTYDLTLRKEGYQEYSAGISIDPGETRELTRTLPEIKSLLAVLVRPWGSIYINGEKKAEDTGVRYETELPAGIHRVRVEHPRIGIWERDVEVREESPKEIEVDFNRQVNLVITSDPVNCEIYINGEPTGEYTPRQIQLPVGKHTIEVKRDEYVLDGDPVTINIEEDMEDRIHFELRQE